LNENNFTGCVCPNYSKTSHKTLQYIFHYQYLDTHVLYAQVS